VRGRTVDISQSLREVRAPSTRTDEQTYLEVRRHMSAKNIRYIHGYPSAIAIFVRWLRQRDPRLADAVTAVFPVSEPLTPVHYHAISQSVPYAKILPFYGLSEKSAFGVSVDAEQQNYR